MKLLRDALYYTQAVLAWAWFMLACIVILFVIPFRWKDPSLGAVLAHLGSWGALKFLGFRIRLEHSERLYINQPCVYVGNHQSNWDTVTTGSIYPPRTVVIGKRELRKIPIFGFLLVGMGNILIDRSNHRKALAGFKTACDALRERGLSIWVFPEGHRNHGIEQMLPFKKGAFHMAIDAQVPIVPIIQTRYVDPKSRRLSRRHSIVRVLEPIPTKGMTLEDMPRLMTEVRARMHKELLEAEARLTEKPRHLKTLPPEEIAPVP